jgi:hypothetical protein
LSRKKELLKLLNNDTAYAHLVTEMVYLEEQLDELRALPKIKVHPTDKTKQKTTPAAKLYKEYLQQYTNIVRILMKATGADEADEDSPLRLWMNERINKS